MARKKNNEKNFRQFLPIFAAFLKIKKKSKKWLKIKSGENREKWQKSRKMVDIQKIGQDKKNRENQ